MGLERPVLASGAPYIDFQTEPRRYRHWKLSVEGEIATLTMDIDADGGLFQGYQLKLNSYDLGVDIELADAVQRLRFEHPEVKAVILKSAKDRTFCAGANIRMLAGASHAHKVNFCKFTNETRNAIEEASARSGQKYLCAVNGTAAGGGYELALATDRLLLVDDGSASVSLPEVPLLGVLPGTGGLTRVTDKRKVRRDLADVFCTLEEGIKGKRAVEWRLVDEVVPRSRFDETCLERARQLGATSDRPDDAEGVKLGPLERSFGRDRITYPWLTVEIDRPRRVANLTIRTPDLTLDGTFDEALKAGDQFYPLALARMLDDAILHLRFNEPEIGLWLFRAEGSLGQIFATDGVLMEHGDHWFIREVRLYWGRVLKRLDVTSRTLVALVEPTSCFVGSLAEILFACDRTLMLDDIDPKSDAPTTVFLNALNFGTFPMPNGLSRLDTRFLGAPETVEKLKALVEKAAENGLPAGFEPEDCERLGLVTVVSDEVDWEDDVRLLIEERASFSPDALTGMEANLRFPGPETMESKIFARLTAWQNWIFQRPNAVGEEGALKRYGTGRKPAFDPERV